MITWTDGSKAAALIEPDPISMEEEERTLASRQVKKMAQMVRDGRKQLVVKCKTNRKETRAILRQPFAGILATIRTLDKNDPIRQEVEWRVRDTIDMAEQRHFNILQNEMERMFVRVLGEGYDVVMRRVMWMNAFDAASDEEAQMPSMEYQRGITKAPELIDYYRMDVPWSGNTVAEVGGDI